MICSSVHLFVTSNLLSVGLDSKLRRYSNQGARRHTRNGSANEQMGRCSLPLARARGDQSAVKCFADLNQSTVKPATSPVIGSAFEMRDRKNHNFVFPNEIDNREGKLLGKDAPRTVFVWRPCIGQCSRQLHGCFNGLPEPIPKSNLDGFVMRNAVEEFKTRVAMKARFYHWVVVELPQKHRRRVKAPPRHARTHRCA